MSKMSLPAVVDSLDQDFRYKSVATQISHDTRLAPVHPVVDVCEVVIMPPWARWRTIMSAIEIN